jgi:soluble lytic murein transglycosylase-like protein
VGQINPPSTGITQGRVAGPARRLVSVLVLVASVAALALIVRHHYDQFWLAQAEGVSEQVVASADAEATQEPRLSPAEERRYRALSDFVAKRYRVSQDVAYDLVHLAHNTGQQIGIDPLLIIAVIAIESRFNPIAESINGAKGLMQIIPKYHTAKFEEYGGEKAVFDPVANVKVGARILKEYLRLTGNLGIALQMYAGALSDGEDQYTTRVMNEQQRLKQVVSGAPSASRGGFTRTAATTAAPPAPPVE